MTHPCADHPCDHCYRCDVLGECCQTPLPGVAVVQRDVLHDAVIEDARKAAPSLSQLVRAEGVRPRLGGLLLPGPPDASPVSTPYNQQKEAIRVAIPRPTQ
jgi:hypothetical protein